MIDVTIFITDRNGVKHEVLAPTDMNMNIIIDGFLNKHSTQLPATKYSEAVRVTNDTFFHANKDNVNLLYTSYW
jgi:hypothetical protein